MARDLVGVYLKEEAYPRRAAIAQAALQHRGVKFWVRGSHVQRKKIGNQASSPEGESATPGLGLSHIWTWPLRIEQSGCMCVVAVWDWERWLRVAIHPVVYTYMTSHAQVVSRFAKFWVAEVPLRPTTCTVHLKVAIEATPSVSIHNISCTDVDENFSSEKWKRFEE